jgi:N-formylglutamate amidohydrolase
MSIRILAFLMVNFLVRDLSAAESTNLIYSKSGDLPILLTVPHGGKETVPGVRVRISGLLATDTHTMEMSELLIERLSISLKGKPYVVMAKFSRKYIDANRSAEEAFEDPPAKPVYSDYHNRIRAFITELKKKFPNGALLFDIHGQSAIPDAFVRGTRNGLTVTKMIKQHGAESLIGPKSIFGVLQSQGYNVFPLNTPLGKPPEDVRFQGGFTVFTYGSHTADGIDAIQLEIGRKLRSSNTTSKIVDDLAEAITIFYKTYLVNGSKISEAKPSVIAPQASSQ